MANVKVLIAGNSNLNRAQKGDVIEVVPSASDWGAATVTPDWIRLIITNVPGTQQEAEDTVRQYLSGWEDEFVYSEVAGATGGQQRYRVEASPEIANDINLGTKQHLRDEILSRFSGTLANQSGTHIEFDTYPGLPLDEIQQVIRELEFRRYRFPDALVDAALGTVNPGEPAEFTRTVAQVQAQIIDKLRS